MGNFIVNQFAPTSYLETRAETAQTMANSEVYEKSSESHEKFMRKLWESHEKVKRN